MYYHDLHDNTDHLDDSDDNSLYDIDSHLDLMEANATERKRFNPLASMPKQRWIKLSTKDQEVWDTLSEETKIIILEKALPPKDRPLRTCTAHAAALDFIQSQCHLL